MPSIGHFYVHLIVKWILKMAVQCDTNEYMTSFIRWLCSSSLKTINNAEVTERERERERERNKVKEKERKNFPLEFYTRKRLASSC